MEENENIYEKLKELFGDKNFEYNILQEEIDMDIQLRYFDISRKVKKSLKPFEVMEDKHKLYSSRVCIDDKEEMLAKLASVEDVKAYRFIEQFYDRAPENLHDWTALAIMESKMMLLSKLMDENQILISTGLGGEGFKLRYFSVFVRRDGQDLDEVQKRIIRSELIYTMKSYSSWVESIDFSRSIVTVTSLIPMNVPVKNVFEQVIAECNNLGNFLDDIFIVTNVKKLTFREIRDYLNNKDDIIRDDGTTAK